VTDTLAHRLREALGPDYTLERELGGGGMSRVFVATERALGRRVVVKVLPPDLAAGVNMERFRREIQLAAQLQHPHIVPLLTAGERDDLLWFTMPFIEGESLRLTLERGTRLPPRQVIGILRDVLDALAYAHARGVVHRDIKPGNILMSGAHALITDFGVAKALSAAIPIAGHTTSGMAIGTPAYMAPEQLAADPAADHRVDIYGVGLLAYELLTGHGPFTGSSPQATLAAQLTERPTPPHTAHPDVPAGLSRLIMRCLEKDANDRPASATALLAMLGEVEAQLSGELAAAQRARSRRHVLAGALLFAAAAALVVFARSGGPGTGGPAGPVDDSLRAAAPETVVVYRDVFVGADEPTGVRLPVVLSPAESVATQRALEARRSAARDTATTTPGAGATARPAAAAALAGAVSRDSIVAEVARIFADSMARALARMEEALAGLPREQALREMVRGAQPARPEPSAPGASEVRFRFESAPTATGAGDSVRTFVLRDARGRVITGVAPLVAPPAAGTRRLAILPIADRTGDSTYAAIGDDLVQAVARGLRGVRGRVEVLPPDVTRQIEVEGPSRSTAVGFALRAHYVLSGALLRRNDSLVLVSVLVDVQGGSETRAHQEVAPLGTPLPVLLDPTVRWVRARIDSMRPPTPSPTRNGGTRDARPWDGNVRDGSMREGGVRGASGGSVREGVSRPPDPVRP
jgi:serine/threonine-protein kinase